MGGGPQNLYNLLSQFSTDSYCILTSYEAIQRGRPTGKWLDGEYLFYDHMGPAERSPVSPSRDSRRTPFAKGYESLHLLATKLPGPCGTLLETVIHAVYLLLSMFMIVWTGIRIVRKRNIRSIMGVSDIGPALISTYLISRCTGVPYALYLFDIYLGNNLQPVNELLARIFEARLFRTASLVIVTNEGAERFYRRRYGNTFKCAVIQNSVFPDDYETKRTPYTPREPYSVLFTGHVYWPQERSLMNLMQAIGDLSNSRVQLDLYVPNLSTTSETLKRFVACHPYIHLSSAAPSQMPSIQCSATILFLPLSWYTRSPEVIATATPGKLADYLASGRPILIHAPPYAYVSEYAKKNHLALVVDEESPTKLQDAIKKLIVDVQYSRRLIENALQILYRNHDARTNAKELARILELP
jgi:glycosyltransferase involved in cell wall biosynthesis